jgi:hypothetical protein
MSEWKPIENPPRSGRYIVGNAKEQRVGEARYMANKKIWKFPNAGMRFEVTYYMPLPAPPAEEKG